MEEKLRLALVQIPLKWEDAAYNRNQIEPILRRHAADADVFLLPEMFTTGFSMRPERLSEPPSGPTLDWMRQLAAFTGAVLCGSIIVKDQGHFYNRLLWVTPKGQTRHYDKRHLFTLAKEDEHYSPGQHRLVLEYLGWRICPLICYDLRFPVWSRNTEEFDLLLYTANWPAKRRQAWNCLLPARAVENQCYVAGLNRVGTDGNGIYYSGDSAVFDYQGELLCKAAHHPQVMVLSLEKSPLLTFREKYAFLQDRDQFEWH